MKATPIVQFFFPRSYRSFPQRRLWLGLLRAVHLVCLCIFVGGFYYAQPADVLFIWFLGVMVSGLAMFAIDLYTSFIIVFELRGVGVLLKIAMSAWVPWLDDALANALMIFIVAFSSLVSHSSRRFRHHNLLPQHWRARLDLEERT